jgi:hypothetical protein
MTAAVAQNIALLPRIADPDRRANVYVSAGSLTLVGRFAEVLHAADMLEETTARLTPHHRVHAAGMHVGVAFDMGRWARVCELTAATEAAVAANLDAPCVINQSSLLLCAIGHEVVGNRDEAHRLEFKAEGFDLQGYDYEFDQIRLMLALSRGDLDRVQGLVEKMYVESTNDHWLRIVLLDGLLALGDHGRILKLAPAWVVPGTYLEPFALRALGAANHDEAMVAHAAARFEAMGLDWHADRTRKGAPAG